MKILLTANKAAGLYALRILKRSDHEIAGIVAPTNNVAIYRLANVDGIPVLNPRVLGDSDFGRWLTNKKVDVLLNVDLHEIIHSNVLEALKIGGFNLHPGPLPEYAGVNTPVWAIYKDEKTYGTTLHWLTPKIDGGPVAYRTSFPVMDDDTAQLLSNRCTMEGMELITKLLEDLKVSGEEIPKIKQDLSRRVYYTRAEIPQNGVIDWNQKAKQIERLVRACNYGPFQPDWRLPVTVANEKDVEVVSVSVTSEFHHTKPGTVGDFVENGVKVATRDTWLIINACKVDGLHVPPNHVFHPNDELYSEK